MSELKSSTFDWAESFYKNLPRSNWKIIYLCMLHIDTIDTGDYEGELKNGNNFTMFDKQRLYLSKNPFGTFCHFIFQSHK